MYSREEKVFIWLSHFNSISVKKYYKLLEQYSPYTEIFDRFDCDKDKIVNIIGQEVYNQLKNFEETKLNEFINKMERSDIKMVTFVSEDYPERMKETNQPPLVFYCKGDTSLFNSPCFAVVGTRRLSRYGKEMTEKFTTALSDAGLTIVSGLADGTDSAAHKATLDANGKTIAVLGSGIESIYPATNIPLTQRIIDNGGLLTSEYLPNEKPQTYYFPYRNRIIAGLSMGVLIPEATEKSGSMHTKEFALEYGRDVYAIPGRLNDIYSAGCNKIIQNCQSAMVLSPADILNNLGLSFVEKKQKEQMQTNLEETAILNALDAGELLFDQLQQIVGYETRVLNTLLTRMELLGLIKKLPGNYYSK